MKVKTERVKQDGKRTVTVELDEGEKLMAIQDGSYYRLGYPLDHTIVQSHHLADAVPVVWDVVGQEWIE